MTDFTQMWVDSTMVCDQRLESLTGHVGSWSVMEGGAKKRMLHELETYEEDPCGAGKSILVVEPYKGPLVKDCPGTRHHICCGYKIINVVTNCPMDCSYCILQGYLNNPCVTVHPQMDKIFEEVGACLDRHQGMYVRFGTGELSDSLVIDNAVGFAREAVPFFARTMFGILELKTKAADVSHLLPLEHNGKTVVSWSLNPPAIVEKEELHTATLTDRLRAARACHDAGYALGFHFDPLIYYAGWERDYRETVDLLFDFVSPARIMWISLGGLRYPPALKNTATARFPDTSIFTGEFVTGEDGKYRYLKGIRIDMYRKVCSWLHEYDPSLFVYLCMERDDVWHEAFGWSPKHTGGLNRLFHERIDHVLRGRP